MIKFKGKTVLTLLIVVGSCSILQFFVVGGINIIRGYTMATYLPFYILLPGYMIFAVVLACIFPKKWAVGSYFSITASTVLLCIVLISISHGRYLHKAKKYYNAQNLI